MNIGIVNDSIMASEVLRRIVTSCDKLNLLWMAENGSDAVINCQTSLPDLILMDLMMPVMDGVEATRRIMQSTPCAILLVTASVTGNSSMVYEAMGAGALDAVATPILHQPGGGPAGGDELLRKIELISKLIGCDQKPRRKSKVTIPGKAPSKRQETMVVIGASTGGPQAITTLLENFPVNFPASVVIIQHMDKKFSTGLISWLDKQSKLPVRIIREGNLPQKGKVLLPSTDHHLVLCEDGTFSYSKQPEDNFYHPSVDVFFQSIASNWPGKIIGVLLTGMGRDGALGLLDIKKRGFHTIAQDRHTSIVYGMPKAAMQLKAATEILPLAEIGPKIVSLARC